MVHLVRDNSAVLTYCSLPVIEGHIEYITFADAMNASSFKAFDCVDCLKKINDFARHPRPPEE